MYRSWGSSDSTVSEYGMDDRGLIPGRGNRFFFQSLRPDWLWNHPASYSMSSGGPFLGGKAWPGREADHSPPSSAEVKNE
jgi:hypothetical protein